MSKDFDFNNIGKRMPYTTPENYLDDIEKNVMAQVQTDETPVKKARNRRLFIIASTLVAASIALLLVFKIIPYHQNQTSFDQVEQAFANLSNADQDFLMEVYEDDFFINE